MEDYENLFVRIEPDQIHVTSSVAEGKIKTAENLINDLEDQIAGFGYLGRGVEKASLVELGGELFNVLFNEATADVYYRTTRLADSRDRGVRICLNISGRARAAADIPWEVLYEPQGSSFLALSRRRDIVRFLRYPHAPVPPLLPDGQPVKLLFAAASPTNLPVLSAELAWKSVGEAFGNRITKAIWDEYTLQSATFEGLGERLRNENYSVVHLLGHARRDSQKGESFFAFEDENDEVVWVPSESLGDLFRGKTIRLVVLEASESSALVPGLISAGVPSIICFNFPTAFEDANNFLNSFYSSLVDGLSVAGAARAGRKSIMLSSHVKSAAWGSVVLYTSNPSEVLFPSFSSDIIIGSGSAGAVIYSGGGMAGNRSFSIEGENRSVGGDVIGRDNIASSSIATKSGGSTGAAPEHVDQIAVKEQLELLEQLAVNAPLTSAQRVQGFAYLDRLEKALNAEKPDWGEIEKLLTRISQLSSDLAGVVQKMWSLLPTSG